MNTLIKYWSYLIENEDKEISFETYILSEDKKTYIQKHQSEEDFNKEILDKYWNEIRSRIKGKPEADIDKFWMNKSFKELANFVNNFDNRNQKERKTDKNKEAAIKAGAHYLDDMQAKNGLTYEIWIPTSHKSANILRNIYKGGNGIGTAWCITVADSDSYWNDYIEEGNNFVFLINKDPILSKTDYRIDDKIAIQMKPTGSIILWDMNDNTSLDKNNFQSIIDFAFEKGEADKLFPNKYDKCEKITIGGEKIRITGPDIDCKDSKITSLEGSPKEVDGNFDCSRNQLTSLEGAPQNVVGNFNCRDNQLTSLKGGPQEVGGIFDCSDNKLTSLEGCPQKVGSLYCGSNYFTSLEGAPQKVNGNLICVCGQLTSLEGCPKEIGRSFDCRNNQLTSLEGCPKEIEEIFDCSDNKLTSLEGCPEKIGRHFNCWANQLTSLKGAPQEVGGIFDCSDNKLTSLEEAPWKVGRNFYCDNNPGIPQYKIDAYKAYLKLSDSEKVSLTKNNHYYPTEEWENKFKH